jgi:fructokinase
MFVGGAGEVLWDLLPAGKQLGGAPANFVYFAGALGAKGLLVSRVGADELGKEALRRLEERGTDTEGVTPDAAHETGRATVTLDAGVPHFTIHQPAAWDFILPTPAILARLARADAICFGTLGRRHAVSRSSIRQMVSSVPKSALRVFDVNLRKPFYSKELIDEGLDLANVLKLNEEELAIISEMYGLEGAERRRLGALRDRFEMQVVALTKGAAGSLVMTGRRVSQQPAMPTVIRDTVGAGDAFTAGLVMGLLRSDDLDALHARAARLAAYVCSRSGATPPVPTDFGEEGKP